MTSSFTPSPFVGAVSAYAPEPHDAPCDLDLAGSSSYGADPVLIADACAAAATRLTRYPDARPLAAKIAARFGVAAHQVLVTAGADEALERTCRAALAPGRNAIVTDPTFEMLPRYVALAGGALRQVAWPGGVLPVDRMIAAAGPGTSLVAIVTPNNPTGAVASLDDIRRVHDALPAALILLDFAYAEFADEDLTVEVLKLDRVVVARTLSKAWGMPGIRVGYAMGQAPTIATMRAVGGPFPVATASLAVAEAVFDGGEPARDATVARVKANRARLEAILAEPGEVPARSQGNFVCISGPRARWIRDGLAGFGIAARLLAAPRETAAAGADAVVRLRITVPSDDAAFARLEAAVRTVLTPEAILFDLDGVFADVSGSYREAIGRTAAQFGVTVSADAIRARKALGNANNDWAVTTELINAAGATATLAEVTDAFERIYQGEPGSPGLRETERLIVPREWIGRRAARYPLAIVTGRPHADAERFLDRFKIRNLFRVVVTLDDGPLKPEPFPVAEAMRKLGVSRAWMIGDTPDDIASARGAGALPIGVIAPGEMAAPDSRSVLFRAGAARVLDSATGIDACLP